MNVTDLFIALTDPDIAFFRYAFMVGILASVSFGIIGTYVVTRRITYIAGAISHCVLGGIGAGLYLQYKVGLTWFEPMYGGIISALLAAVIIGLVSLHANEREDTVIGALWAVGMAIGLLFISRTPGYIEPMSYLFGNILLITTRDIWLVIALDALILGLTIYFFNIFQAICFDEEFTGLRGINTDIYFLLLLGLTALTVVLLVRIVGIVMVIALLTLPPAVAGCFSRRLWQMMAISTVFCMFFIGAGLAVSYSYDLPSGPTIIVIAGIVYLGVITGNRLLKNK